jgi:hypothetical protein
MRMAKEPRPKMLRGKRKPSSRVTLEAPKAEAVLEVKVVVATIVVVSMWQCLWRRWIWQLEVVAKE